MWPFQKLCASSMGINLNTVFVSIADTIKETFTGPSYRHIQKAGPGSALLAKWLLVMTRNRDVPGLSLAGDRCRSHPLYPHFPFESPLSNYQIKTKMPNKSKELGQRQLPFIVNKTWLCRPAPPKQRRSFFQISCESRVGTNQVFSNPPETKTPLHNMFLKSYWDPYEICWVWPRSSSQVQQQRHSREHTQWGFYYSSTFGTKRWHQIHISADSVDELVDQSRIRRGKTQAAEHKPTKFL